MCRKSQDHDGDMRFKTQVDLISKTKLADVNVMQE